MRCRVAWSLTRLHGGTSRPQQHNQPACQSGKQLLQSRVAKHRPRGLCIQTADRCAMPPVYGRTLGYWLLGSSSRSGESSADLGERPAEATRTCLANPVTVNPDRNMKSALPHDTRRQVSLVCSDRTGQFLQCCIITFGQNWTVPSVLHLYVRTELDSSFSAASLRSDRTGQFLQCCIITFRQNWTVPSVLHHYIQTEAQLLSLLALRTSEGTVAQLSPLPSEKRTDSGTEVRVCRARRNGSTHSSLRSMSFSRQYFSSVGIVRSRTQTTEFSLV
jgi:hypothetical protein